MGFFSELPRKIKLKRFSRQKISGNNRVAENNSATEDWASAEKSGIRNIKYARDWNNSEIGWKSRRRRGFGRIEKQWIEWIQQKLFKFIFLVEFHSDWTNFLGRIVLIALKYY